MQYYSCFESYRTVDLQIKKSYSNEQQRAVREQSLNVKIIQAVLCSQWKHGKAQCRILATVIPTAVMCGKQKRLERPGVLA